MIKIRFTTKPKKNIQTPHKETISSAEKNKLFKCPYCDQIITIDKKIEHTYIISCPQCGHKGIIDLKKKTAQSEKEPTDNQLPSPPWFYQPHLRSKIVGIFLIITGLILLLHPTAASIKLSITLFFIAGLLLLLISEKKFIIREYEKPEKTDSTIENLINKKRIFLQRNRLIISEKITLLIITATLILFLITNPADLEIFLVLLYLSLLIIKELIDEFTPAHVKKRLNLFVIIFFIIFLIIIAERIITILNI